MKINQIINFCLSIVYPNFCCGCNEHIAYDKMFCDDCEIKIIEAKGKICNTCFNLKKYCNCRRVPKWYKRCCAPFEYDGAISGAVVTLKRYPRKDFIRFSAEKTVQSMVKHFHTLDFDVIVPVPLHKSDKRKRGYNQSLLLAKELSEIIGIPYTEKILLKPRKSKPQHTLERELRKTNAKGMYKAVGTLDGFTILLVDDVITTGSTINECAKVLRLAGAAEVYACAIAKTMGTGDDKSKKEKEE